MNLILSFLISSYALAAFPVDKSMDCRFQSMPNFGYLLKAQGQDIVIDVISHNVSEGEKTRMLAKEGNLFPNNIYIIFLKRYENSGNYLEFIISKQGETQRSGFAMFTEATYSKNPDGTEHEELHPIAKKPISCHLL